MVYTVYVLNDYFDHIMFSGYKYFSRLSITFRVILFAMVVPFTDKAEFRRNGIINFYNAHVWIHENPHTQIESLHQQQFSFVVWVSIVSNNLIEAFLLPNRLNTATHLVFLENYLLGAPAHFA